VQVGKTRVVRISAARRRDQNERYNAVIPHRRCSSRPPVRQHHTRLGLMTRSDRNSQTFAENVAATWRMQRSVSLRRISSCSHCHSTRPVSLNCWVDFNMHIAYKTRQVYTLSPTCTGAKSTKRDEAFTECECLARSGWLFIRATTECFARLSYGLGIWLSVCLSVALRYCIKRVHARITKSSLWAAAKTLVFSDEISCRWVRVSLEWRRERGVPHIKKFLFYLYWLI